MALPRALGQFRTVHGSGFYHLVLPNMSKIYEKSIKLVKKYLLKFLVKVSG